MPQPRNPGLRQSSLSQSRAIAKPSAWTATRFAAIDFETADNGRDSACALAIVIVEGEQIIHEALHLIRPPRPYFLFSYIHGITWHDVADKPTFREIWPDVAQSLQGVDFLAAHNAGFDRSVLFSCCHAACLEQPTTNFQCTAKLARQSWALSPARLPDVCRHLDIPLHHHQALSDARACAQILLAARCQGLPLSPWLGPYAGRLG